MLRSNRTAPLEVLIVDDDKVVALLHKHILKSFKIQPSPITCTNGLEALEYISKNDNTGKRFLVLLDLNMPVVNGWKFLKGLEKNPPKGEVLVVIVTSSINQKDFLKAQSYSSVIHFCTKPLSAACITTIRGMEQLQVFFKWNLQEEKRAGK